MNIPNSGAVQAPTTAAPALSCDAHIHIYEAGAPCLGEPPVGADTADYRRLGTLLGVTRAVIVQPRLYGTDNSVTLRAIQALGAEHTRGIAVIDENTTDTELARLQAGGIRGIRLSLHQPNTTAGTFEIVEHLANRIAPLGWHLQLHWTADQIASQKTLLQRLPVALVFDHLARFPVAQPLSHPAFPIVRDLLESGRAWVKLSGPYLESTAGSAGAYRDTDTIAQAWLQIAPHRALWGSDWPHVTETRQKPDDAQLLDILARWCDDEATLHCVLVDNPAQLYEFNTHSTTEI